MRPHTPSAFSARVSSWRTQSGQWNAVVLGPQEPTHLRSQLPHDPHSCRCHLGSPGTLSPWNWTPWDTTAESIGSNKTCHLLFLPSSGSSQSISHLTDVLEIATCWNVTMIIKVSASALSGEPWTCQGDTQDASLPAPLHTSILFP